ncbi:MAG: iron ABC transporter permease [Acidobacteriaceae bacterium]|nr:iron ABC transporter permease [Acidobacteriaceae bacterium]
MVSEVSDANTTHDANQHGWQRWLPTMLAVALVFTMLAAACVGAVRVPLSLLLKSLLGGAPLTDDQRIILLSIRLPRIIAAAIVGSALSVSGLLFQGLFRNPLADPYVIGSSGGAVLGASIGVFLLPSISIAGFGATTMFAFIGAVTSILLVYWLAHVDGHTPVVGLLLAGFAVSTMLSYSSYFLEVMDHDFGTGMKVLSSWLHGSIAQPTWPQLLIVFILLCAGLLGSFPLARHLNTLALGEEYATNLGLSVQQIRIAVIVIGSILTAAAVALGGLISFAGLIVPHILRMILGPDHHRLLPSTALAGALFLLIADTIARTIIAPSELPVGVLTAFIGGPFFLYLLRKTKQGVMS